MTTFEAIVLGFVQGFTEFLPVSSSGHLVLAEHLLRIQNPEVFTFDIYVHFGTILSIIIVLRHEIQEILQSVWTVLTRSDIRAAYCDREPFRLAVIVLVGTIPAAIVGLLFRHQIRDAFTDPKLVSMNLVITGLILFLTRLSKTGPAKRLGAIGGLVVGIAQALAILPGISRTGTTMSVAMYLGISPGKAARLSFLLAVPVILGAAIVETRFFMLEGANVGVLPIVAGTIVSATTGYVAIKLLLRTTEKGKFNLFSIYCLVVGLIGIIFIS